MCCSPPFRGLVWVTIPLWLAGGGCTVGPDYEEPVLDAPDAWTRAIEHDLSHPLTGAQQWWLQFNDPTLNALIRRAREASPNIRIARKRIEQAWYQRGVLAASFYPHVDATGRDEFGMGGFSTDGIRIDPFESNRTFGQIDYGWEIDLFGRVKRSVQATEAEWQARYEGLRDAQVFISAEVAITYIAMRTMEKRLEVAIEGTENFRKIRDLIQIRYDEGISARSEIEEAKGRYNTTLGEIPRLQKELKLLENKLAQLLAYHPGQLDAIVGPGRIPVPPTRVAAGVPANLIRSRPDVRRAERKIASQNETIGFHVARLYPAFSISGAITYEAITRGGVLDLLRRVIGIGWTLRQRIYHACADHYRIKEHQAILEELIIEYEKTLIQAVTDVEDAMVMLNREGERLEAYERASEAHGETAELLLEAYKTGLIDVRRLLNGYEDTYLTDDEKYATEGRRAAHAVRLFKALGGGELPAPEEFPKPRGFPR
ncbi:MAG: efflux transporter outer membrane subunit [Verrucomicrobiota bacterium]